MIITNAASTVSTSALLALGARPDNPAGSVSGISRRTARCSAVSRGHPGHALQRVTLRHLAARAGIRSVPSGNPVRTLTLPVDVEILWRPAVGTALQPFERKSASDRGLSSMSGSARLVRRRLPLPEPGSCARTSRCGGRATMDRGVFRCSRGRDYSG